MVPLTPAAFVETLRSGHLLEPTQLSVLSRAVGRAGPDPRPLARQLIRQGWLTPYQANQLLQGKGQHLKLGHYLLLERLGEGGMGSVYKARNQALDRVVAIKVVRDDLRAQRETVDRFRREIEMVARLSHPNIVMALDAGESEGEIYFVMEFLEGISLASRVKRAGPLPLALACEYARQAAVGLQHAHEHGLVHRDVKPSNLFLCDNGATLKILDLGLGRLCPLEDLNDNPALTRAGRLIGTPDYIAGEQAANPHGADIRADLYGLGCTLYFAITGRVPFPGGTTLEKLFRHMTEQPTPPEWLRPGVPAPVSHVVSTLMAKRPQDRYQTPAEAAAALTDVLSILGPVTSGLAANRTAVEPQRGMFDFVDEGPPPGSLRRGKRSWSILDSLTTAVGRVLRFGTRGH